jgi:N-acetyl-anhydromuramyl-L-alanine amidase AmpD
MAVKNIQSKISTPNRVQAPHYAAQFQACFIHLDDEGMFTDTRVINKRQTGIEHGPLSALAGIIVHQTGGSTSQSTFDSYKLKGAAGAHFLIDTDGTVYQTASVFYQTYHVGKLRSRCVAQNSCSPIDLESLKQFSPKRENAREMTKNVPERYPANIDSVGIELVGAFNEKSQQYAPVTDLQNAALQWLVAEITSTFNVPMTEIFRHPEVSRKQASEASTAKWVK